MITLHHLNNSRSQRIIWLLEELGVDYDIVQHQRDPKTQLAPPSLRAIHPLGKSPVIVDESNQMVMAESGAIIEYLIQVYGDSQWQRHRDQAEYWDYVFWLHYSEGSVMPPLVMRLVMAGVSKAPMPFFAKPIARSICSKVLAQFVQPNISRNLAFIESHLHQRQWFNDERISGADVQMSFALEAGVASGLIDERFPAIRAFVERCHQRPAYQRALKRGGEYAYA
ncbi:glutathione S-transferase [Simiduia curdlanivorans]|uniref:Glutathione S-transferase family protein n=1 Tax=Simiduia curdlanivorans TaxID=1492769 RepID=A0ABV8V5V5_9GAMM|nr:glutathione S-transferase [Simiduia curdlanivorans]MDN3638603.1 glutathione S-transferase [Simiduia curdlanivorans]